MASHVGEAEDEPRLQRDIRPLSGTGHDRDAFATMVRSLIVELQTERLMVGSRTGRDCLQSIQ